MTSSSSSWRDQILCATMAGITSTILGHPLDTIKVHLQAKTARIGRPSSMMQQVQRLRWNVFRGMGPPLLNSIVMNTIMFSVFHQCQESLGVENKFVAGLCSGFATAMISTPTDYFKIHSQLGSKETTPTSWNSFRQSMSRHNPSSLLRLLYRGHVANLGREGVFTMVYLGLYYHLLESATMNDSNDIDRDLWTITLTSALTGALAWIVSYPLDTIKTIRQSSTHLSYRAIFQQKKGFLYAGCATSTGRAILVTSSRMMAYELCMRELTSDQNG